MRPNLPLMVFSHLRWDFVYQRPQHLLTRLARNRQVFFIEEPVYDRRYEPYMDLSSPTRNVTVARPHTRSEHYGFNDEQLPLLSEMVQELIEREELTDYVVWLYTPMALPLARTLNPRAVVFDVMDELSAFKNAPQYMKDMEQQTLDWADVVFTGGPSLYRAKRGRHSNLHCFSSSVDAGHFAHARHISEAPDQADIPHPRFGFYGVIDERMDFDLLSIMAKAHPDWQIVMVGPVTKIDPTSLPQHPNIHYMGPRQYNELPSYLAGWDVCMLPFALNESTRFISPTKTLEYMAAELPIVSTPIADVAGPYGDIVYLGGTPKEFIQACEDALNSPTKERERRTAAMRAVLENTSWDTTVQNMEALISSAVEVRSAGMSNIEASSPLPATFGRSSSRGESVPAS